MLSAVVGQRGGLIHESDALKSDHLAVRHDTRKRSITFGNIPRSLAGIVQVAGDNGYKNGSCEPPGAGIVASRITWLCLMS